MNLAEVIRQMPKAELHVHLEGAIQPATLLRLAKQNHVTLPADSETGIRDWYEFTDFPHFIEIYRAISSCIRTPDDLEMIMREFLCGQAEQHILYSEVIFTPYNHFLSKGLRFEDQLAALMRAVVWARQELGIDAGMVLDISRETTPDEGLIVAGWGVDAMRDGVLALGLGGPEVGHPPEKHQPAFEYAHRAGLPSLPHAGETEGPASIWGALDTLYPNRILHGVRCVEDAALVERLRQQQIALDVCPTSNICLKVYPSLEAHPLPKLIEAGLVVTINSDDPPMFNTRLTDEYQLLADIFKLPPTQIRGLAMNSVHYSLLSAEAKRDLAARFEREYDVLFSQLEG